jgi:GNAT superfamily N-acetyltransferase
MGISPNCAAVFYRLRGFYSFLGQCGEYPLGSIVSLEICRATAAKHATGIAQVRQAVWPDDDTADSSALDEAILDALQDSNRVTYVAVEDDRVVGFADGFLTISAEGVPRWEVDLLAVHPEFRERKIGQKLVTASVEAGQEMGAKQGRALVQFENYASQQTFARCGFDTDSSECILFVSSGSAANFFTPQQANDRLKTADIPPDVHLISVRTLYYRGLWLEGELSFDAFDATQAIREHYRWDIAGAVIPVTEQAAVQAARSAGYKKMDRYWWWRYDYSRQ